MPRISLAPILLLSAVAYADDVADLKGLDQQWAQATMKGDSAALNRIFADDLRYVHGNGAIENKQQFLAALKTGGMVYRTIEFDDVNVRVLGNTGIVTSTPRIRIRLGGEELDFKVRFLRVYVKDKGAWRLSFHQATRLP